MTNVFVSEGTRAMSRNLNDLLDRWKLRREVEKPKQSTVQKIIPAQVERKIDTPEFFTEEEIKPTLEEMTIAQLDELESEILNQVNDIKFQLAATAGKTESMGRKYAMWTLETGHIRRKLHELGRIVGNVRSSKKRGVYHKSKGFHEIFTDLAREKLPPELFEPIELLAKQMAEDELKKLIDG